MLAPENTPDTRAEFLIAGHSNILCMGAPWGYTGPVALVRPTETFPQYGYFVVEQWMTDRSAEYWECLVRNARDRHVIVSYAGNQHLGHFLFAPDPLVDFFDPRYPDDAPLSGATLVARALIKDFFRGTVAPFSPIVSGARAAGAASVTILGTPPPRADMEQYRDQIEGSATFHHLAKHHGVDMASFSLTPSVILRKLWGAHQELLEEMAAATGSRFVPVPGEACDSRGFLLDEYSGDFSHGNHQFGRLMLDRAGVR